MSATVSFRPTRKYLGPIFDNGRISYVWNGVSWHTYKTDCTLSFSGVHETEYEDYAYSYVFATATALFLATVGAGAYAVKHRRSKGGPCRSKNGENAETMESIDGDASIVSSDVSIWELPLSRSMKRIKSLFSESNIGEEQTPDSFVQMEGQDGEIVEEEGIEIAEIYKHKRKSFLPRFLRRNR